MPKALTRIELFHRSTLNPDILSPVGVIDVPTQGHVKIVFGHDPIGAHVIESSEVTPNEHFEDARNELEKSLARLNEALTIAKIEANHASTDAYQFHKWTVSE